MLFPLGKVVITPGASAALDVDEELDLLSAAIWPAIGANWMRTTGGPTAMAYARGGSVLCNTHRHRASASGSSPNCGKT
jgi:hypothetical protein